MAGEINQKVAQAGAKPKSPPFSAELDPALATSYIEEKAVI